MAADKKYLDQMERCRMCGGDPVVVLGSRSSLGVMTLCAKHKKEFAKAIDNSGLQEIEMTDDITPAPFEHQTNMEER